jgi:beta-hydroxylase
MSRTGLVLIRSFEYIIAKTTGNGTFYDPAAFPWIRDLEASYPALREEALTLLESEEQVPEFKDISEEQARITRGAWKTHLLYMYGHKIAANCRECPETTAAVESIPGMTTAMFSILAPQAHLTPHRGPFKGVLRYHLGLIVPTDASACAIRVKSDLRHWTEGLSLVFDDTHEHEAWNRSDQMRIVLFVDFLRAMPFPLSHLNRLMIRLIGGSPFVQNMMIKLNELTERVSDVPSQAR